MLPCLAVSVAKYIIYICRARSISFQETLDRLRKQNLDEEGLDRDTERWKKILEHRHAEKGQASGSGKSKKLWDVVIDAFNSEHHPLPKKEQKVNAFVEFITRIQMAARRVIYQVVENEQFSLFVAGKADEFGCIQIMRTDKLFLNLVALIIASVVVVIVDSPQGFPFQIRPKFMD